jgi:lipopolysaccharide export system protein LptC
MKNVSRKLKVGLFLGAIIIGCVVFFVFVGVRMIDNKQEKIVTAITSGANMSIDNVHQIATRDGVKEWSLDASSAELIESGKKALFKNVSVVFFLKDNSKVLMTAEKGILRTKSNDLTVKGNVIINNGEYTIKTEKLHYKHISRIVTINKAVKIFGKKLAFNADGMTFDMNTSKVVMEGNVKGTIRGRFYNI